MNFRQEDRICRKGADDGANFGIGKHFRQEDRICRMNWMVDCGVAAVAVLLRASRLRRDKVAGEGSRDFGFYFDILLDFGLVPPTADSFRTWKPISFLGGSEAGVTNG